jgi:hypothetical protein
VLANGLRLNIALLIFLAVGSARTQVPALSGEILIADSSSNRSEAVSQDVGLFHAGRTRSFSISIGRSLDTGWETRRAFAFSAIAI